MTTEYQLVQALVNLLTTSDDLYIRSNTPRHIMEPYHQARMDAYEALRAITDIGGTDTPETLTNAYTYLLRHAVDF
jgi:hypothetical protein